MISRTMDSLGSAKAALRNRSAVTVFFRPLEFDRWIPHSEIPERICKCFERLGIPHEFRMPYGPSGDDPGFDGFSVSFIITQNAENQISDLMRYLCGTRKEKTISDDTETKFYSGLLMPLGVLSDHNCWKLEPGEAWCNAGKILVLLERYGVLDFATMCGIRHVPGHVDYHPQGPPSETNVYEAGRAILSVLFCEPEMTWVGKIDDLAVIIFMISGYRVEEATLKRAIRRLCDEGWVLRKTLGPNGLQLRLLPAPENIYAPIPVLLQLFKTLVQTKEMNFAIKDGEQDLLLKVRFDEDRDFDSRIRKKLGLTIKAILRRAAMQGFRLRAESLPALEESQGDVPIVF